MPQSQQQNEQNELNELNERIEGVELTEMDVSDDLFRLGRSHSSGSMEGGLGPIPGPDESIFGNFDRDSDDDGSDYGFDPPSISELMLSYVGHPNGLGPMDSLCSGELEKEAEHADRFKTFKHVLASLKKDQIPRVALALRQKRQPNASSELPEVGKHKAEVYEIYFPITFPDGLKWVIRIPVDGTSKKWSKPPMDSMFNQINMMRMLKRETTIPLPEVIDSCITADNALGVVYTIMEVLPGKPLKDFWFAHTRDRSVHVDTLFMKRMKVLEGIASAMYQLGKYTSEQGGGLKFDDQGQLIGTGPIEFVDLRDMFASNRFWRTSVAFPKYRQIEPYSDTKNYNQLVLDMHPDKKKQKKYKSEGQDRMVRLLSNWVPEPKSSAPFVLTFSELDFNNVLVNDEGEVQGIIDWGGLSFVPRSVGNQSYPRFLTTDWMAAECHWRELELKNGGSICPCWSCDPPVDQPMVLGDFRRMYHMLMKEHRGETEKMEFDPTRMSLITKNLESSAGIPEERYRLLVMIIKEMWSLTDTRAEWETIETINMFTTGKATPEKIGQLKKGWLSLLRRI